MEITSIQKLKHKKVTEILAYLTRNNLYTFNSDMAKEAESILLGLSFLKITIIHSLVYGKRNYHKK